MSEASLNNAPPSPEKMPEKTNIVKEISEKYDALVVHGISNQSMVMEGNRSILLLNTLVNQQAEISATIAPPDNTTKLFVDQGVIIAEGQITLAATTDVFSRIDETGQRVTQEDEQSPETTQEIIRITGEAAKNHQQRERNEVFIKNMQFSGYFAQTDNNGVSVGEIDSQIVEIVRKLDIPLVAFGPEGASIGMYDEKTKRVKATKEFITTLGLVNKPIVFSPDQMDWIVDVLRDNFPYKQGVENYLAYAKGFNYLADQSFSIQDVLKQDPSTLTIPDALLLYGYAEGMRKWGWEEMAKQAIDRAKLIVNEDQYTNFYKKIREGKLMLDRNEMKQYLQTGMIDWF